MAGAEDTTELLVFETLGAGVTGADVYQHAPTNAPLPLVIVGDLESVPIGGKNDPDRRVSLTIIVLTEGEERSPCTLLCDQVVTLLDGVTLTGGGFEVSLTLERASIALATDGLTYDGTISFTAWALSSA